MSYYEGLNEKLAAALPDARHVLEIGCASGMLGAALLAARACLYGGAGRVYVGLLDLHAPTVDLAQPVGR